MNPDRIHGPEREPDAAGRYRQLNAALLGLALYLLAVPFILPLLVRIVPFWDGRCTYLSLTGRPCPLCGMTRAGLALAAGDVAAATRHNAISVPLFLILLAEVPWRLFALAVGFPRRRLPSIARADWRIHLALALAYSLYAVVFVIRGWLP